MSQTNFEFPKILQNLELKSESHHTIPLDQTYFYRNNFLADWLDSEIIRNFRNFEKFLTILLKNDTYTRCYPMLSRNNSFKVIFNFEAPLRMCLRFIFHPCLCLRLCLQIRFDTGVCRYSCLCPRNSGPNGSARTLTF